MIKKHILQYSLGIVLFCFSHFALAIDKSTAQDLISKQYPGALVSEIESFMKGGVQMYEVEFKFDGKGYEAILTADGEVRSVEEDKFSNGNFLYLGLFVESSRSLYEDIGTETEVYPGIFGRYGNFWFFDTTVGYSLYDDGKFNISPIVEFNFDDGYEESDGAIFAGLEDRDDSIDTGIQLSYDFDAFTVTGSILANISDSHGGHTAEIGIDREFVVSDTFTITPGASAIYQSDDYNQYFFGVNPGDATAFRPAYQSDAGFDYEIEVATNWFFSEKWALRTELEYEIYSDEVTDSPLVDETDGIGITFGLFYEF